MVKSSTDNRFFSFLFEFCSSNFAKNCLWFVQRIELNNGPQKEEVKTSFTWIYLRFNPNSEFWKFLALFASARMEVD